MNKPPLISIIVPCYKVEDYLPRCVESMLVQTYKNLEIFLVDDGSPDRCGAICDEYAKNDKRIKVIHKYNGGLADARNVAIDVATGDYFTFIDSDDFVTNDYVETLVELLYKYHVDMAVSSFIHKKEDDKAVIVQPQIKDYVMESERAVESMFYQQGFDTSAWGKIYKRDLFGNDIRYPKGFLYEDLPTTYKLMFRAGRVAITTKKTYFYLIRENSIIGNSFNPQKNDILKIGDTLQNAFSKSSKDIRNAVNCRMLSAYFNVFLQMERYNEFEQLYWNRICELRKSVLLNINARKKARIAALLSFLGITLVRFIFRFINRRK